MLKKLFGCVCIGLLLICFTLGVSSTFLTKISLKKTANATEIIAEVLHTNQFRHNYVEQIENAVATDTYYYVRDNGITRTYNKQTLIELPTSDYFPTPVPSPYTAVHTAPFWEVLHNGRAIQTYVTQILGVTQINDNAIVLTAGGLFLITNSGDVISSYSSTPPTLPQAKRDVLYSPVSLSVYINDIIVTCGFKKSVMVFRIDNNTIKFIDQPIQSMGTDDGMLFYPQDIAVISQTEYFVSDLSNRISYVNTQHNTSYSWGVSGTKSGQLNKATLIAYDGENTIYVYDAEQRIQQFTKNGQFVKNCGSFTDVKSLKVDVYGNVFVLDGTTLYKNFEQIQTGITYNNMSINLNGTPEFLNSSSFVIDYLGNNFNLNDFGLPDGVKMDIHHVSGTIFITTNHHSVKTVKNVATAFNFVADFAETKVQVATANTNTALFKYPYNLNKLHSLQKDVNKVIVVASQGDYSYVISNGIYGYVLTAHLTNQANTAAPFGLARIIYNNTKIYKHPSSISEVKTINVNTQINLISTVEYTDHNGHNYYQTDDGFVNVKSVIDYTLPPSNPNLKTNAYVNLYDGSQLIKVYNADGTEIFGLTLIHGQDIYVENFTKATYTFVRFINEAGIKEEGYILTKYVTPNSISTLFLIAVILFVSSVIGCIFLLIKIRNK
ncbi:MAG: hypothetical protein FWD32_01540 [Firmicutes bacterium]|nr:hypothetical protein [Bacillota bacterium]